MAIFHLPFSIYSIYSVFFSARIFQLIMPHIVASCVELSNSRQPCPVLWSGTRRTALSPTPTSDGKRPSSSCEILAKFSWNSFENYSYFPGEFSFSVFPKMKIFCSLTKKEATQKKSRKNLRRHSMWMWAWSTAPTTNNFDCQREREKDERVSERVK